MAYGFRRRQFYAVSVYAVITGYPFPADSCRSGDTPFHAKQRQIMGKALYRESWHQDIKEFYEYITLRLLHENSYKLAGINQVDVTRE